MTDHFGIYPFRELVKLILHQLDKQNSLFGIPAGLFFNPANSDPFKISKFGRILDTPIGVAAGPQTQLTQNIVLAWLCGARFIELKTVQTLDELNVSKPCIDMQDEGYNCEWSQELKIENSFDQYLNAWVLIHLLKHKLGHPESKTACIFNMSIGYDHKGIIEDNVQNFLHNMQNAGSFIQQKKDEIKDIYPQIETLRIDACISDNITLSTMHGCPPQEIESIAAYLLREKRLHTAIKLNPTLLGKKSIDKILLESGFDTMVPSTAFEHDLKMEDAVPMINNLQELADSIGLDLTLKLTNTLECINHRDVFPVGEKMMYMSGRALHPIALNLAFKISGLLNKSPDISFCAGVDAFNISAIVQAGLSPVTVCSDLLKPGGYGRLHQYIDALNQLKGDRKKLTFNSQKTNVEFLKNLAIQRLKSASFKKHNLAERSVKTSRRLPVFDCAAAPCMATCPTRQNIPAYLYYTEKQNFKKALECILETNPFPGATGLVCDHTCQYKCTRMDMDDSVRIRDIKRFISESVDLPIEPVQKPHAARVAVIGAGPSGLSLAYFIKKSGLDVEIFEASDYAGGMVAGAIPSFRLNDEQLDMDLNRIRSMGISVQFGQRIDASAFNKMQRYYDYVYISIGAQRSRKLLLKGLPCDQLFEPIALLQSIKSGKSVKIGPRVVIIGGGNTAIDTARTAKRIVAPMKGDVTIIYRRTIKQMPAEQHEIDDALKEGIKIIELLEPLELIKDTAGLKAIRCQQMKLGPTDASGRSSVEAIEDAFTLIPADSIIPAIGQEINIDFTEAELLQTEKGSYRTKLKNVFIGGDALRGASTLIHAIADGKNIALEIIKDAGSSGISMNCNKETGRSIDEHMRERMTRKVMKINAVAIQSDPTDFKPVNPKMAIEEVIQEAARCLHCDEVCNICTTVCPNMALQYYPVETGVFDRFTISIDKGFVSKDQLEPFRVEQKYQIMHLADWCNTCGNCNTFCPSADAPYRTKPRLYFNEEELKKEKDGYYFKKDNLIRTEGKLTYTLKEESGFLKFTSNEIQVDFHPASMAIINVRAGDQITSKLDTLIAIEMNILLQGSKYIIGN